LYGVVNAIRQRPTHSNLMFPGIGVGGYCLTKDPLLASWARSKRNDLDFMIIEIKGILIPTGLGSRDRLTFGERLVP
jgi:UDP-N-acetyl-D-mannosaminuronate dehydrogenase